MQLITKDERRQHYLHLSAEPQQLEKEQIPFRSRAIFEDKMTWARKGERPDSESGASVAELAHPVEDVFNSVLA